MSYSSLKRKQGIRDLIQTPSVTPNRILSDEEDLSENDSDNDFSDNLSEDEKEEYKEEDTEGTTLYMLNHNTNYSYENPDTHEIEKYYYLSDDVLSQTFEFINDHNDNAKENIGIVSESISYQIHLALFQMKIGDLPVPFLLYLLEKQEEQYQFPTFEYKPAIETNSAGLAAEETDESSLQIQFINECLTHVANLFSKIVTSIHESNKNDFYKGFIQTDRQKIYVFFDVTTLLNDSLKTEIWSSLEEIILYKNVNGTPVDSNLAELFSKNSEIHTIRNQYGNPIPVPHILYLCKQRKDEIFENVFRESEESDLSLKPIDAMIEHPFLGELFSFTYKPIGGYNPELIRFLGYTENALYLLIDIPSNVDAKDFKEIRGLEKAECIYYREGNQVFWGFRNTTNFVQI
jgi:hypothetical protein